MACAKLLFLVLLVTIQQIRNSHGHGRLMDPVNRSSAWRLNFSTPINNDDDQNYCGGLGTRAQNEGKCGACGDAYTDPQPRQNENGGFYGTGTIVKTYEVGQKIDLYVYLTTNHWGIFEFSLCPLNSADDIETEECFEKHPIKLDEHGYKYEITSQEQNEFHFVGYLPEGLRCEHCTLRWHWKCANNWGLCENGRGAVGCGNQEYFRSCSDVAIL